MLWDVIKEKIEGKEIPIWRVKEYLGYTFKPAKFEKPQPWQKEGISSKISTLNDNDADLIIIDEAYIGILEKLRNKVVVR